jgi:hypothetical protein
MNTAATATTPGATKATSNPTYYGEAGSPKGQGQESSRILFLCLRGIVAFLWAASLRTLEKMLFAYLQSTVNPTLRSLIAILTATARGGGGVVPTSASAAEAEEKSRALRDKEGAVTYQASGACVNSKKGSWTYMRGAFSRLYPFVL